MFAQLFGGRRQPVDPNNNNDDDDKPPTKRIKTDHHNVLVDPFLFQNIVSFLDNQTHLQLAACSKLFFQFFCHRAKRTLAALVAEVPNEQQDVFLNGIIKGAIKALPEEDRKGLLRQEDSSFWRSMWTWLWGKHPPRKPLRYYLLHAYKVPIAS